MNFEEIISELPKLTPGQRELLRVRLAELAGEEWIDDGELSPAEKKLLEERLGEYHRDPDSGISLEELESRLRAKFAP